MLAAHLDHEVGEVARQLRIGHHLPLRGQQLHVALDVEELLADQHEFARQLDVVGVGQRRELPADVGIGHVAQRLHGQRGGEGLQVLGGLSLRLDVADGAHHYDDLARRGVVLLDQQRIHQLAQQPAGARVDAAHDAEVEEHDLAVGIDVQVAGMQVAVEQAVPQPALEHTEQQGLHQLGAVEARLADGRGVVDADASHPLHRQHPLAGQVPIHLRHTDVLPKRRGVHVRHPGVHRLCLEPEVELLGEVVGEVGDDVLGGQPPAQFGQLDELRASLEDLQIRGDAATNAGTLDLDDDVLAAVQGRVVHLCDRCRGEGLVIEALEQLGRLVAELLLEQLVHFAGVGRWDRVEQAAELPRHRLTERARARRDDLAEFDVRGAQVDERLGDLLDDLLL